MMKDRTYRTWIYMRQRCLNPNDDAWKDYGGRGVTICDRWDSFDNFLVDMGERPAGMSLDRIDNDGNYEPGNARWSTPAEQAHNKRNNLTVTAFGETKVAGEWVRDPRCAVSSTSLRRRLKSGRLSPEEAISKPSRNRNAAKIFAVALVVFAGLAPARTQAGEHPIMPVAGRGPTRPATGTSVNDTLRALAALRSMNYHWTSAAGADKAIRSWQKSNGLQADGIIGPKTLASLGLPAISVVAGMTAPAPVLRSPSPPVPAAEGDVEQIIRDVWPADLADKAVAIATRESRLQPTAHNSCCIGLFSIYFAVHRAWLAGYGVNQPSDLYDPRVNATVALALYQQAGWQPWAL